MYMFVKSSDWRKMTKNAFIVAFVTSTILMLISEAGVARLLIIGAWQNPLLLISIVLIYALNVGALTWMYLKK